jgi:glutaredoxin-like protein NrdH
MADAVFLYALSTCGWCRKTKDFLNEHEVEFEFVDVDLLSRRERHAAQADVLELSGGRLFPVVVVGETVVVGYNPKRLAELLELDGG